MTGDITFNKNGKETKIIESDMHKVQKKKTKKRAELRIRGEGLVLFLVGEEGCENSYQRKGLVLQQKHLQHLFATVGTT